MRMIVRKVPLNFDWPIGRVWAGFKNPHLEHAKTCTECRGTGETVARRRLRDLISLLLLSGKDARRGKCHLFLQHAPLNGTQGLVPGVDMVELTSGLSLDSAQPGRSEDWLLAEERIIAAAGLSKDWGTCPECQGEKLIWASEGSKQAYESWEPEEPPCGPGFQLWESDSEGSPISPVLANEKELKAYLELHPRFAYALLDARH